MIYIPPFTGAAYRRITGTDRAAGGQLLETVPAGKRWLVLSMRAQLVTDANVALRRVHVVLDDGAAEFYRYVGPSDQSGSQTITYVFAAGVPEHAVRGSTIVYPLPVGLMLPPGGRIRTEADNFQGGDNWGAPRMYVVEFSL